MTNNLKTNNISAAAEKTHNVFCILECVCMAACFQRVGAALRNDLAPRTLLIPQMPRSLHWGEDRRERDAAYCITHLPPFHRRHVCVCVCVCVCVLSLIHI